MVQWFVYNTSLPGWIVRSTPIELPHLDFPHNKFLRISDFQLVVVSVHPVSDIFFPSEVSAIF